MPVLDTSFLIDLDRRRSEAIDALNRLKGTDLIVPAQAATEFIAGYDDPLAALSVLQASFRLVLPDEDLLVMAAQIRQRARDDGKRPAWGDVHIAAATHLSATYIVTADKRHFRALDCRLWDYRNEDSPPDEPGSPETIT